MMPWSGMCVLKSNSVAYLLLLVQFFFFWCSLEPMVCNTDTATIITLMSGAIGCGQTGYIRTFQECTEKARSRKEQLSEWTNFILSVSPEAAVQMVAAQSHGQERFWIALPVFLTAEELI